MIKRIVVAGCRNYNNYDEAKEFIDFCIDGFRDNHTLIFLSGGCSGADALGEKYAKEKGYEIERYPAEWQKYGRAAGPIRNKKLAELGDYIICFWDGKSKGTKSMIQSAERLGKTVMISQIIQTD